MNASGSPFSSGSASSRTKGYKRYRYENKQRIETPVEKVVEDNWVFVHPSRMDRYRSILAPSA